jgi:hypothetical protein
VLKPLLAIIGDKPLRDLTANDVRGALVEMAKTRSTRTVQIARNCLTRAIKRAEANDLVRRKVAALAELPQGQAPGRPSKAMTLDQAKALMAAAESTPLHAYIVLSVFTGMRPEEARALRWDVGMLCGDYDDGTLYGERVERAGATWAGCTSTTPPHGCRSAVTTCSPTTCSGSTPKSAA